MLCLWKIVIWKSKRETASVNERFFFKIIQNTAFAIISDYNRVT